MLDSQKAFQKCCMKGLALQCTGWNLRLVPKDRKVDHVLLAHDVYII